MVAALVAALLAIPAASHAQSRRPAGEEWNQVRPLFALIERVAAGAPAPADVVLSWQCHFVDADAGVVLVPFTLDIRGGTFTSLPVAMYVRVVLKGAPAPAPGPTDALAQYPFEDAGVVLVPFSLDIRGGAFTSFPLAMYVRVVLRGAPAPAPGPADALAQYPFEDAAIVDGPIQTRISRAFTAPPGTYDVYVALTERPSGTTATPKTAVVKQEVTIPDLKSGLTTSSIIVAEQVEADNSGSRATYEQQLDNPYRLWGVRITPATRRTFSASENLSVLFVVYQAKAASNDKPDVDVSYSVHRSTTSSADGMLAGIRPERFNAETLPPGFSLSGGDLILAGRQIPLDTLPAGAYRLEIVVTDNAARAAVRRTVPFSVGGRR